jgi:hypothetical protein
MWGRGRWRRCSRAGECLPQVVGKHVDCILPCCFVATLRHHSSRHHSLARVAIAIAILHFRHTTLLSLIPTMVSGTPESDKSIKPVLRCVNPDPQPLGSSGSASPNDNSPTRKRARWSWAPSLMTEEERKSRPIIKRKGKRKSKSKKRRPQSGRPERVPMKRPWYRRL